MESARIPENLYYLTMTSVAYVDAFSWAPHRVTILNSLAYCQKHKATTIHAWCLMSNHLHLLVSVDVYSDLSDFLRDFKKFTSKKIVSEIFLENEQRRDWMLYRFQYAGKYKSNIKDFKFWQDGSKVFECHSEKSARKVIDHIHQNPVRALIVDAPAAYLYSSARDYDGIPGILPVTVL